MSHVRWGSVWTKKAIKRVLSQRQNRLCLEMNWLFICRSRHKLEKCVKKDRCNSKKTLITDYVDLSVAPATHCNIMQLQHTVTLCNSTHELDALRLCSEDLIETHCNTLQYSVTHCNTLQHTATATCYNSTHELDALKLCAEDLAELPVWQVWMRHVTYQEIMSNTNESYHACEWVILRCRTLQRTATHLNTLQHTAALNRAGWAL